MPANDLDSFGRWLKQRREARDLTQKELAEATGCSLSTIRKMEAGLRRPSKQVAELLAEHLAIDPADYEAFLRFAREGAEAQAPADKAPTAPQNGAPDKSAVRDFATRQAAQLPASATVVASNLPNYPTAFIGRQKNVEQVLGLLWRVDVRLLTIIGPPGIGKTRLAVEAAARLLDDFADGVFFVSLAPITDPALLLPAIADALSVKQDSARSLEAALTEFLARKNILLALDNFEQLVEGATVVADLLRVAPRLKVLATSRTPLDLYGEHEYTLAPLELPQASAQNRLDQVQASEAVQLFVRRAQAVSTDFRLTADNAATVGEITRKLDGLPLAIELAAARVRYYEPETLLRLLNNRLGLLTGGPRDAPARHKTLRAAIAWSYDLLDPAEQKLFRGLGCFVGGCAVEAVTQVCALPEQDARRLLQALVAKSMIVAQHMAGAGGVSQRYAMLETLREYALELLQASGESAETFTRHALFFSEFAEQADPQLSGAEQKYWLDALEDEQDNLLAALNFCATSLSKAARLQRRGCCCALARALGKYWYWRNRTSEGRAWLLHALETHDKSNDAAAGDHALHKIEALIHLGTLDWQQGEHKVAQQHYSEALQLSKRSADKLHIAMALNNLGNVANVLGDFALRRDFYEQSLDYARELGEQAGIARLLNNLGVIAHKQEDYAAAIRFSEEGLELRRAIGNKANIAYSLSNLGWAVHFQGDLPRARALQEQALELGRELGSEAVLTRTLSSVAAVAFDEGDFATAKRYYYEALELAARANILVEIVGCLEGFAQLAAREDWRLAALLEGASDTQRAASDYKRSAPEQKRQDASLASARSRGATAWRVFYENGRKLALAEAVALALGQRL